MHFGLAMWYYQWKNGKFGLVEHPAKPCPHRHPEAASIWNTIIGSILASLEDASVQTIAQGYFGAPSPKPTGLLLCHAPMDFQHFALGLRTTQKLPPPIKLGKSAGSNQWNTSKLKEYPAGFCSLIAHTFLSWWTSAHTAQHPYVPDAHTLSIFQLFQSEVSDGEMGPDFARNSYAARGCV